jgi:aminoglycoside phosphotransferase (APT) family kinase protein
VTSFLNERRLTQEELRRDLGGWLEGRVANAEQVTVKTLRFATEGHSAETLFAEVAFRRGGAQCEQGLVIRKQVSGLDLFLDSDLTITYRVLRELEAHPSVLAPRAIGVELDRAVLGDPFLVMQEVKGRVPPQHIPYTLEGWVKDLAPADRGRMWRNALAAQAALHRLDWREGFTFLNRVDRGPPGWQQYISGIEEWHRWAAAGRTLGVIDAAMAYVRDHRPSPSPPSVLWGDAQVGNMMFNDDLSVAAILDWEAVSLGPAEADFGWWLFFCELLSEGFGLPQLAGVPDREESTAVYEAALGRAVHDVNYYELLACLRMALIIVRATDRQIAFGRIPPDSRASTHNPVTEMIARKMGLPPPESLPDFAIFHEASRKPGRS